MTSIIIVYGDDWAALYKDGISVYQDNVMPAFAILEAVDDECISYCAERGMNAEGDAALDDGVGRFKGVFRK